MPKKTSKLTVVLLNWRQADQTIESIKLVRSWKALKPQLRVVDNESTSETKEALAKQLKPDELICSSENLGFGGGNNLAIKQLLKSASEYILLLNTDATVTEEMVSKLLSQLDNNSAISIIGPVIEETIGSSSRRYEGGRDIAQNKNTRIPVDSNQSANPKQERLVDVVYVPGMVFLVRRSIFEKIGLFDEAYFFSGEVADLCKRVSNQGSRIVVDLSTHAAHDTGQTSSTVRDRLYTYYNLRNRFLFIDKHYAGSAFGYRIKWIGIGIWAAFKALLRAKPHRARAILLALKDGLSNQFGNSNAKF